MPINLRISDIQNFENTEHIYIHDIENDTYVDLKEQDFSINLESGAYASRFEVTFSKTTLNTSIAKLNDFNVFQDNNLSVLTINNPNSQSINSFQLYDVTGKQVLIEKLNSNKAKYSFSTKSLSEGLYIAKITSNDFQVFSKKVIITNKK